VILDTSAILALVFDEPEKDEFIAKIGAVSVVGVGAPTLAESAIILASRLGEDGQRHLEGLIERSGIVVIPFDSAHWTVAVVTAPRSTSEIALPMPRHASPTGRCCARATISDKPTFNSPR
jgi:ribonuclease VapC